MTPEELELIKKLSEENSVIPENIIRNQNDVRTLYCREETTLEGSSNKTQGALLVIAVSEINDRPDLRREIRSRLNRLKDRKRLAAALQELWA